MSYHPHLLKLETGVVGSAMFISINPAIGVFCVRASRCAQFSLARAIKHCIWRRSELCDCQKMVNRSIRRLCCFDLSIIRVRHYQVIILSRDIWWKISYMPSLTHATRNAKNGKVFTLNWGLEKNLILKSDSCFKAFIRVFFRSVIEFITINQVLVYRLCQ